MARSVKKSSNSNSNKQYAARKANIKKAQKAWQSMSPQARARARAGGSK